MKNIHQKGFSLAEMMVVLLITSIILAATAPMVTKKMARSSDSNDNDSFWLGNDSSVVQKQDFHGIKLNTDDSNPVAIDFGNSIKLSMKQSGAIWLSGQSIETDDATNSVVIGKSAKTTNENYVTDSSKNYSAVAIGDGANATRTAGIAIGSMATAKGGIAIGTGATANHRQITIGHGVGGTYASTVTTKINIGEKFKYDYIAPPSGKITLGGVNDVVVIPGKLEIQKCIYEGGALSIRSSTYSQKYLRSKGLNNNNLLTFTSGNDSIVPASSSSSSEESEEGNSEDQEEDSSDIRLKNVGEMFEEGLEQLKKLKIFHYTFKDDPKNTPRVGVMAQDLQKVFPDAVTEGKDGYLRIRTEDMFYAMVNAVKELDTRFNIIVNQVRMYFDKVDKLEKIIESQNARIEELEKRLEKLELKCPSLKCNS